MIIMFLFLYIYLHGFINFFIAKLYNWDNIYRGSGYTFRIIRSLIINIVLIILIGSLLTDLHSQEYGCFYLHYLV